MECRSQVSSTGKAVEIFGFTLTGTIGFVLNVIIVLAVVSIKRPYICTQISLHLGISNAIGSVLVVILQGFGDTWLIEHNVCHLFLVFKSFWCISVMLLTCFLVYESFFKTKSRLNSLQKGEDIDKATENCLNVRFTIILVWVSSCTVAFITFLLLTDSLNSTLCISYQHTRQDLARFYYGFIVILPLVTIAILNILYKRLSINQKKSVGIYNQRPGKRIIQRHLHYTKSCFRLGQVLQMMWLPHTFYMFCLINWFVDNISFHEMAYHMLKLLQWFCYSSSICQPLALIYTNYQIKLVVLAKTKAFWYSSCCNLKHTVEDQHHLSSDNMIKNSDTNYKVRTIDETDTSDTENNTERNIQNGIVHLSLSQNRGTLIFHNEAHSTTPTMMNNTRSQILSRNTDISSSDDSEYGYPASPDNEEDENEVVPSERVLSEKNILKQNTACENQETVNNVKQEVNVKDVDTIISDNNNTLTNNGGNITNPIIIHSDNTTESFSNKHVKEKEIISTNKTVSPFRPERNIDKMFSMELADDISQHNSSVSVQTSQC